MGESICKRLLLLGGFFLTLNNEKLDPDGKILGMTVNLMQDISSKIFKHNEDQLLKSIIGSKIIDFKIKHDPKTKHMYNLTIITDANNIPATEFHKFTETSFLMKPSDKMIYIPSMIKLRVRL